MGLVSNCNLTNMSCHCLSPYASTYWPCRKRVAVLVKSTHACSKTQQSLGGAVSARYTHIRILVAKVGLAANVQLVMLKATSVRQHNHCTLGKTCGMHMTKAYMSVFCFYSMVQSAYVCSCVTSLQRRVDIASYEAVIVAGLLAEYAAFACASRSCHMLHILTFNKCRLLHAKLDRQYIYNCQSSRGVQQALVTI